MRRKMLKQKVNSSFTESMPTAELKVKYTEGDLKNEVYQLELDLDLFPNPIYKDNFGVFATLANVLTNTMKKVSDSQDKEAIKALFKEHKHIGEGEKRQLFELSKSSLTTFMKEINTIKSATLQKTLLTISKLATDKDQRSFNTSIIEFARAINPNIKRITAKERLRFTDDLDFLALQNTFIYINGSRENIRIIRIKGKMKSYTEYEDFKNRKLVYSTKEKTNLKKIRTIELYDKFKITLLPDVELNAKDSRAISFPNSFLGLSAKTDATAIKLGNLIKVRFDNLSKEHPDKKTINWDRNYLIQLAGIQKTEEKNRRVATVILKKALDKLKKVGIIKSYSDFKHDPNEKITIEKA